MSVEEKKATIISLCKLQKIKFHKIMLLVFFVVSPGGHPELLTKVHPACRRADGLPVTPPHDKAPAVGGGACRDVVLCL